MPVIITTVLGGQSSGQWKKGTLKLSEMRVGLSQRSENDTARQGLRAEPAAGSASPPLQPVTLAFLSGPSSVCSPNAVGASWPALRIQHTAIFLPFLLNWSTKDVAFSLTKRKLKKKILIEQSYLYVTRNYIKTWRPLESKAAHTKKHTHKLGGKQKVKETVSVGVS